MPYLQWAGASFFAGWKTDYVNLQEEQLLNASREFLRLAVAQHPEFEVVHKVGAVRELSRSLRESTDGFCSLVSARLNVIANLSDKKTSLIVNVRAGIAESTMVIIDTCLGQAAAFEATLPSPTLARAGWLIPLLDESGQSVCQMLGRDE